MGLYMDRLSITASIYTTDEMAFVVIVNKYLVPVSVSLYHLNIHRGRTVTNFRILTLSGNNLVGDTNPRNLCTVE